MRRRRLRRSGGTPIEEAPLWVLAILTALLWLLAFPGLTGLLAALGWWQGERLATALAAAGLALAIVVGAAVRKPWRRAPATAHHDPRPWFLRFSGWLLTALLLPNVLLGAVVLTHPESEWGAAEVAYISVLISTVHAALAVADRWRRRGER